MFHVPMPGSETGCETQMEEVEKYLAAATDLCGAGTHMLEKYCCLLKGTPFEKIAGQFHGVMSETAKATQGHTQKTRESIVAMWAELEKSTNAEDTASNNKWVNISFKMQFHMFQRTITDLFYSFCAVKMFFHTQVQVLYMLNFSSLVVSDMESSSTIHL